MQLNVNEETYPAIELYKINIEKISFNITEYKSISILKDSSIIHTAPTNNYFSIADRLGFYIKTPYKAARLRGSSITLNDLSYEPNKNGHRLFIKNGRWQNLHSNRLFYRYLNNYETHDSWNSST